MSTIIEYRKKQFLLLTSVLLLFFLISLGLVLFPLPWIGYLNPVFFLLSIFLLFFLRSAKGSTEGREEEQLETAVQVSVEEEVRSNDSERQQEYESTIQELESTLSQSDRALARFSEAVEMEERLAAQIFQITEASTLKLTEHVYSLADKSRQLSSSIEEQLLSLSTGESSLAEEINLLRQEVSETKELIENFHDIKDQHKKDMETVSDAVQAVGDYIATISEIAEQTAILAINASIEAARAGNIGKGFAVIAGEVHKLADSSRDVAISIGQTLEAAREKVIRSYQEQKQQIESAVKKLDTGREKQLRRADVLFPHVEKIGEGVNSSRAVSEDVQRELDHISASLQSQDSVRQILEHMIEFLQDLRGENGKDFTGDRQGLRRELEELLSKRFTTREEWKAFGKELNETLDTEQSNSNNDEGDITLF